ncbi:N-terminal nucleophile aminohydrolase [Roridomyces roridus]|uniref:N-terminal nucleophile aminohydrolase n=1 Tax=Roridomyces roridus TaxID=1738132 RepID=A0AAD7CK30_9AGAR|nr:N-terminal nucleophile aminohydrolase [Roridomyces roridus]
MCRWFAYLSATEAALLEDVLIEPAHSLAKQIHEHYLPYLEHYEPDADPDATKKEIDQRNRWFNADGFGVAWYTATREEYGECVGMRPIAYRTLRQPLTEPAFRSIAANTASNTLFAHVRAASGSTAITEVNCHPFQFGRYLFMHNGMVGGFPLIRRGMVDAMSVEAAGHVAGTTDSEHLAMLFFTYLARIGGIYGSQVLEVQHSLGNVKSALEVAITTIIRLQHEALAEAGAGAPAFEPSSLNIAITDGARLLAIRFRNHATEHPPSLYFSTKAGPTLNRKYPGHPDKDHPRNLVALDESAAAAHGDHLIVASEPTTFKEEEWELVLKNECIMVAEDMQVVREPVHVAF